MGDERAWWAVGGRGGVREAVGRVVAAVGRVVVTVAEVAASLPAAVAWAGGGVVPVVASAWEVGDYNAVVAACAEGAAVAGGGV